MWRTYLYSGRFMSSLVNMLAILGEYWVSSTLPLFPWLLFIKSWVIVDSHEPWPEHKFPCFTLIGLQAGSVQCFPLNPVWQMQVPFLHWPCKVHLGSHERCWQRLPSQPFWQTQPDPWHCPCCPQSSEHRAK